MEHEGKKGKEFCEKRILLYHGVIRSACGQKLFKITFTQMAKFATFKLVSRDLCDYQCLLWFKVHWTDELSYAARQRSMLLSKKMANFVHDFALGVWVF